MEINSFNINNFKIKEFEIPNFTNKLIGIEKDYNLNGKNIYNQYLNWLEIVFEKFGLPKEKINKFLIGETFDFVCYISPFLNEEQLFQYVKYSDFGFLFDDLIIEKRNINLNNLNELECYLNQNLKQNLISEIYWEIINGYYKFSNPITVDRIIKINYQWLLGSIESTNLIHGTVNSNMNFNEYYNFRSIDAAGESLFATCMIGLKDNYISNELYNSDSLKNIIYHFNNFTMLINDLYSFKREIKKDNLLNYVKILSIQLNDIQMSINRVIELVCFHYNQFSLCFNDLISKDENKNDKSLIELFKRSKKTINGIYFAHINCKRYKQ